MGKKRQDYIDVVRGILIIMVVAGHIFQRIPEDIAYRGIIQEIV